MRPRSTTPRSCRSTTPARSRASCTSRCASCDQRSEAVAAKRGRAGVEAGAPLLAQLADALDATHARGLVHRDVKPSNALLDSADHAYLADFGLTKSASDRSALTLTGRIIGTVDYAAPEQIEGKGVDGRADTYSLGCLLYESKEPERRYTSCAELVEAS